LLGLLALSEGRAGRAEQAFHSVVGYPNGVPAVTAASQIPKNGSHLFPG
jgi:hypothetical protein